MHCPTGVAKQLQTASHRKYSNIVCRVVVDCSVVDCSAIAVWIATPFHSRVVVTNSDTRTSTLLSRAFAPQTCIRRSRMSASTLDTVLTTYLSLHAVLALLIDAQSVLPDLAPSVLAAYQRAGLTQPVARWVADEGDFLVGSNPLWFRWIVGGEVLFQLPVCIALAFGFAKRRQWVRLPSLLYGTHVLTYVEATPAMADQSRPSGGWAEASQGSGQPQAWPGAESSLRRASWPRSEPR